MINAERILWQTVLFKAVSDATCVDPRGDENKRAKEAAVSWLSGNSKDFRDVCDMAGMDASFVRESFLSGRVDRGLLKAAEKATA